MRFRSTIVLTAAAALIALTGCGTETPGAAAGQPSPTATASDPTLPTPSPSAPRGTPSAACPATITSVRDTIEKATWGKGLDKARFDPVTVSICRYDVQATGGDYATATSTRTGQASVDLFALLNAPKPLPAKPRICTEELGPTYVLRFTDADHGVLTYAVEAYGCRPLVATSFVGQGKPLGLAAPRQASKDLLASLAKG